MQPFKLRFLDHVGLRVRDLETSAAWYEQVLGLKRYQFAEWGDYPIMMVAGKTGLALFPSNPEAMRPDDNDASWLVATHLAFNVDRASFEKVQFWLRSLGIVFEFQDHHYFHSIYIKDPDGYTIELTTLLLHETKFYIEFNDAIVPNAEESDDATS